MSWEKRVRIHERAKKGKVGTGEMLRGQNEDKDETSPSRDAVQLRIGGSEQPA